MPKPVKYVAKDGRVTYRVRFRLGGRDGRHLQETFHTHREAKAFCSDVETRDAEYALRVLHERDQTDTAALDDIAAEFFDWKTTRVRSDRTVADYRRDWANHIRPTFGHRKAGSVTESDVQGWVDSLHGKLSPKSIGDRHALLHAVYAYAAHPTRRLVDHNPCVGTDLPKKQKPSPKGLMPAEWVALERALRLIDADAADLAVGLLATGWRWSELTALDTHGVEDYGDVMFLNMTQVVRRTADGGSAVVTEGKGQASIRRVRIDPAAANMIRRRLVGKGPGDLVFTTGISAQNGLGGSQWHHHNFTARFWHPAVKAANLNRKPTPHWLRHTHVAWMAMAGASLPELQGRIGHASIKTTIDVYGRMLSDVSPEALTGFAAMRGGGQGAQQVEG